MPRTATKLSELKPGDVLIADGGFTCLLNGEACPVKAASSGNLYIPCADGQHFLDGQLDHDGDSLLGLRLAEQVPA